MNEQRHDMTGAWALNTLDDEERARIEEYLAQDADAAAEARSFEETAGELARSLAPLAPRPELKNSVMARIAQTRQLSPNLAEEDDDAAHDASDEVADRRASAGPTHRADVPVGGASTDATGSDERADDSGDATVVPLDRYRSSVRRSRWLAVAAAALMVTTIGGVGLWGTERAAQQEARATIEAMQEAQAEAEEERRMVSTILASDDAAHLSVPVEDGSLNLMYSREQQAMIVQSADLPALPSGSTYQLWLIDSAVGEAASAGVLTEPDQTVMVGGEMPTEPILALTVEPAGGSEQPTTEPILQEPL